MKKLLTKIRVWGCSFNKAGSLVSLVDSVRSANRKKFASDSVKTKLNSAVRARNISRAVV